MFPGLDAEAHRQIAAAIRFPVVVRRGEHLVRSGDGFHHLYSVHDGAFKAYVSDAAGREHVWGFGVPGDLMGLHAITSRRYQANFVALEDSRVASLSYTRLLTLFERVPGLLELMLRSASGQIARLERLNGDHAANVRIAAFLTSLPHHFKAHAQGD
ncbi:MAG: Crp/Fnr family transcriptional regulator, partial [Gammaproteobacteria bacterium]